MTALDTASSSRVCPSCGRRVPRTIAVCRCGTDLTTRAATEAAVDDDRPSSSASDLADGFGLLLAIVAGVGAMLLVVYWLGRPPIRTPRPPQTLPLKVMPGPAAPPPPSVVIERP